MIKGQDNLIKIFKRLAKEDELSQGYIFFGEPQVGKATFARCLANLLEFGEFKEPTFLLSESLMIKPDMKESDGSIGIDAIRSIKQFLYAKPVKSRRRTVILDDAQNLTLQAQNAILKIAEEPPKSSLLILVLPNPESLLSTLQSRFQKIYFPRASTEEVRNFLIKEEKLSVKDASKVAEDSFGRIGRAKERCLNKERVLGGKDISNFLKGPGSQVSLIRKLAEPDNKEKMRVFLMELISYLYQDKMENHRALQAILKRLSFMSQFNLNKRLQLETSLLWTT